MIATQVRIASANFGFGFGFVLGSHVFYPESGQLRDASDNEVTLRPQTARVLHFLAQNAGEVVSKDDLIAEVWRNFNVTDDSLVQCITEIRKALGERDRRFIKTFPKRGYMMALSRQVVSDLVVPPEPIWLQSFESSPQRPIVIVTVHIVAATSEAVCQMVGTLAQDQGAMVLVEKPGLWVFACEDATSALGLALGLAKGLRAEATLSDRRKTLMPVMIEPCERPIKFELTQTADLSRWNGNPDDKAWQTFAEDVTRLLTRDISPVKRQSVSKQVDTVEASVAPSRLSWAQPPLPIRLMARTKSVASGRAAEQGTLRDAWAAALAGQGQVVLLGGEPGIGKTFLAAEMARLAYADGAAVLFGHNDEDVPLPYRPFVDAFRHAIAHAPDDLLVRYVNVHHGELARLVPELRDRVAALPQPRAAEAEAERYMLFEAAVGLLAAICAEAPVVLVLDDLHWARASDLQLVKHIVRSIAGLPVLIIGTFRDSDIGAGHPLTLLLADLRREHHVHRCALSGIDEGAISAMLTSHAGHDLGETGMAIAHALYRDTAGNPFFITELLHHLADIGAIEHRDDSWIYLGDTSNIGVPDSVREVITRRLGNLSAGHATILGWAAIIGQEFAIDQLEGVLEDSGDDPLDALDAAEAAGLVTEIPGESDRYRFNHALVRITLYDGISGSRRRRMHRRIAEWLTRLPEEVQDDRIDELAYHWQAGADSDRAIGFARRAGARAAEGLAYESAASHYSQALALMRTVDIPGEQLKCDLLLDLGAMQRNVADPAFRATMADAAAVARRLGDPERLAQAALGSGHPGGLQWGNAVDDNLVSLYTEALAALGKADSVLRVSLMGQLATELRFGGERERRHQLTAEALAIARRIDDQAILARALSARIFAIDDPTTLAERLQITEELETLSVALDNAELGCLAASQRCDALLEAGDIDGVIAAIKRCDVRAGQLRTPFFLLVPRLLHTMLSLMRAESDAEQQVLATFQAASALGLPHAANIVGGQIFELRVRQGRLSEMLDTIRAAVEAFPNLVAMRAGLAFALTETGDIAEAQTVLDSFATDGSDLPMDVNWASAAFLLAEAAAALGDRRIAAALAPMVTAMAGQLCTAAGVRCDGSLAHAAGQIAACLGESDAAERNFEMAIIVNDRIGAPTAAVRSRRALAAILAGRTGADDQARAATLVAEASAAAAALGLVTETARLKTLFADLAVETA